MTYLIFDIETVPDLTVWSPPVVEVAEVTAPTAEITTQLLPPTATATPPEKLKRTRAKKAPAVPKELKEPFAPLYAHRPIAIGFVWLGDDLGIKSMGCIGTSNYGADERGLLSAFSDFLTREHPTIVSWNGRGFDVPVLALRSFKHGVPMPWYDKETRHRYGDHHLDLFDLMTEYGSVPRTGFSLDTFSKLIGLPPKDVDGSKVATLFAAQQIETIETYCLKDAISTSFVLLRYFLLRARIAPEMYNAAVVNLVNACRATTRLETFVAGMDATRLLLTP